MEVDGVGAEAVGHRRQRCRDPGRRDAARPPRDGSVQHLRRHRVRIGDPGQAVGVIAILAPFVGPPAACPDFATETQGW